MPRNCCHDSVASSMMIYNFVIAFFGVSIIVYSNWMLNEYNRHLPVDPPPSPPVASSTSGVEFVKVSEPLKNPYDLTASIVLGSNGGDHGVNLRSLDLPVPWFIYSFMAVGILVCIAAYIDLIRCGGVNDDCFFVLSRLRYIIIVLQVYLVVNIIFDRQWEKDFPYDPTGELSSLRAFIEENIYICKWVGFAVVALQLLPVLVLLLVVAMYSTPKPELDEEEDYENPRSRPRDPLLGPQGNQAIAGSNKIENMSSRF